MELKHIDIAHLSVSALNMRGTRKAPDIANILPSVRARTDAVASLVALPAAPAEAEPLRHVA
jgi:ParB family chromosome partitioning protein